MSYVEEKLVMSYVDMANRWTITPGTVLQCPAGSCAMPCLQTSHAAPAKEIHPGSLGSGGHGSLSSSSI